MQPAAATPHAVMIGPMNSQTVERARGVIAEFDAQGWHRTGSAVDDLSGHWLREKIAAFVPEVALEPFALDRIEPDSCTLELEGKRIAATPAFDGTFAPEPIRGPIGPIGSDSAIGVTDASPATAAEGLEDARRRGAHDAIVVVTKGGLPGIAMRNAPSFSNPFGPPVLYVASEYEEVVLRASGTATVHVAAHRFAGVAMNVVGELRGTEPELAPVVVMTPRSGWWHCAAERGGGIACFVEAARRVAEERPSRTVRFLASSGHELNHLGLDAYLRIHEEEAAEAAIWLHLGASIGAQDSPTRDRLQRRLRGSRSGRGLAGGRLPHAEDDAAGLEAGRRVSQYPRTGLALHVAARGLALLPP